MQRRPVLYHSTPDHPVEFPRASAKKSESYDAAPKVAKREATHPGHNRLRPSKPKPSVPTRSVKEPVYGKGKKPKPFMYQKPPHGRYSV